MKCHLLTVKSTPSCSLYAFEALCRAEASLGPAQHHPVPLARPCPKTNYDLHCQSKFDVRAEKNTGLELFGDEGMPPTCVQHNPKVLCALETQLHWDWEAHSLCPSPVTTEQHSMHFKSPLLGLALLLFLLGMGWTQNPLKTGAFYISAFESDPRG